MAPEALLPRLQQAFGFASFRPGQADVIAAVLAGRDVLVVMPTGAGKSLCFQLPGLALPGITLVVSPLIALMKDQVDELRRRGLPATFINSTLTSGETAARLAGLATGEYKLLYVAPERFFDNAFLHRLKSVNVSLMAIDEAHCISEWGHDFRPSYLKLSAMAAAVGRPPLLALTATATPDVREDIVRALGLTNPFVIVTGFDRPNITYGVVRATPTEKMERVLALLGQVSGPALIYAGTRDTVDTLHEVLAMNGLSVVSYHAGMDPAARTRAQQQFMANEVRIMVATNAFGLGIDKPDVRLLVHADLPGTLEAYYQESGRAGRDGKTSYAVLLYHPSDRYLREFFLEGENPSPDFIRAVYDHLASQVGDVVRTTYREILSGVAERAPELAVGTALKVLEQGGYIRRAREGALTSRVQLLHSLSEVDAAVSGRARVRRQVWEALRGMYGVNLESGVSLSSEELVRRYDLSREAISRSLKALADRGLLVYEPPFRGQEVTLVERVRSADLKLDWQTLREKRRRDERKLNTMEGYAVGISCRRSYLLRYFGDASAPSTCQACDVCA